MSYLQPAQIIGGHGGNYFRFTGESNIATLKRICVWIGGWQIKAMKVWLSDGQNKQFGRPRGDSREFQFDYGEQILSLSLWNNVDGDRLGAIQFNTTQQRTFFVRMTDRPLINEVRINVGSGICMGVEGRACADIDSLGFVFMSSITSTVLTNVNYPTLHQAIPQIATEKIESLTYTNKLEKTQSYPIETAKTITKKSSWSVSNRLEVPLRIDVNAGIPVVVKDSTGYSFTVGEAGSYGLDHTEEKYKIFTLPVQVPPRRTVVVDVTIGRATVDLPYTGTVEITCSNGGVLKFNTMGSYKGVTYTDAKTTVTEKCISQQ